MTGSSPKLSRARKMNGLRERYFRWLYDQVCDDHDLNSPYSYTVVCDIMHQIVFRTDIPHDDNRAADAVGLRNDFMFTERYVPSARELAALMEPAASIFEVLVALAKRVNYQIEYSERTWFNIFITNLKLHLYSDWTVKPQHKWRIIRILERFNDRTYRKDGCGGLFPLRRPDEDQRTVELWYQWSAWATEAVMY